MRFYPDNSCAFYDWLPDSCLVNELVAPSQLVAIPDNSQDNGVAIRVYGFDATGKRIYGTDGQDGFIITVNVTPAPATQVFAQIDRISKGSSKGFIKLSTWNTTTLAADLLLGYYKPDEVEPTYRRLRINRKCATLRIAYRKRDRNITSLSDVINLRSKPAIVNAVKALAVRLDNPDQYQTLMAQAVQMLRDEQAQRDQSMPPRQPQHDGQVDQLGSWGGDFW